MNSLRQIISVVNRKRISKIEIFDKTLLSTKDSKFTQLYEAIESGKINSDKEASLLLYGEEDSSNYRKLKSRFHKRLLNTLFFLDLNGVNRGSEYRYNHYSCTKALMHAKLLRFFGGFSAGAKVVKLKYSSARKYLYYDILAEYSLFLLQFYSLSGNVRAVKEEVSNYRKYKDYADSENRGKLVYFLSIVEIVKSGTVTKNALELLKSGIKELQHEVDNYPTSINVFHLQILKFQLFEATYDYENLLEECDNTFNLLSNSKYFTKSKIGIVTFKKLTACLNLRMYDEGVDLYYKSSNTFLEGSYNWFMIRSYGLILALHYGNRDMAYSIYNDAAKEKLSRFMTQPTKESWAILGAYSHFLLQLHDEYDQYKSYETLNKFRLYKFLNEVPIYSKDKSGYNVSLLIIQYIFSLLNGDYESIIQKIDSLKVYRSRYLKDEIFKRPYTFIGMLLKVEKEGFNISRIKRVCAKDYNAIVKNRTGGGPDSENWPVHEWEIIPFERLWVYILKIIEFNELPEELRKKRKIIEDDFTMSQLELKSNEISSD
jgi:hypothetical protein